MYKHKQDSSCLCINNRGCRVRIMRTLSTYLFLVDVAVRVLVLGGLETTHLWSTYTCVCSLSHAGNKELILNYHYARTYIYHDVIISRSRSRDRLWRINQISRACWSWSRQGASRCLRSKLYDQAMDLHVGLADGTTQTLSVCTTWGS